MSTMGKTRTEAPLKTLTLAGEDYPYIETMGGLIDFQEETGKLEPSGLEENLKYMYHTVRSACRRYRKEFSMTFQEFVDCFDPVEFNRLIKAINKGKTPEDPKKA